MILQEYITAEFGIVPDEVQLEKIREIVKKEMMSKITRERKVEFLDSLKNGSQEKRYYPISTKIFK